MKTLNELDEYIRDVLDVLTGWSGAAITMTNSQRIKAAVAMLNALLPLAEEEA